MAASLQSKLTKLYIIYWKLLDLTEWKCDFNHVGLTISIVLLAPICLTNLSILINCFLLFVTRSTLSLYCQKVLKTPFFGIFRFMFISNR